MSLGWAHLIVALVALQRLAELRLSRRNAAWLLDQGAVELGASHYPLVVGVQVLWLLTLFVTVPASAPIETVWLLAYLLLQIFRAWILLTLGRYWTTRVYHLPTAPLIRSGPYRWFRHPNYWVVLAEVAVLPLIFGAWWPALVFGLLQAGIIWLRIRVEERGLEQRPGF